MILIKDRHLHFLQHKRCVLQLGTMILIKNRHRNFFSLFFFCFFLGTMILIKDRHLNPRFKNISCAVGNMILIKSEFWRLGLQFFIIVFTWIHFSDEIYIALCVEVCCVVMMSVRTWVYRFFVKWIIVIVIENAI